MCANPTTSPIFSEEFNKLRATGHQVALQEYEQVTLNPLKPLLTNDYQCIVLWFGDDMFCQMNLLTVLAFPGTKVSRQSLLLYGQGNDL